MLQLPGTMEGQPPGHEYPKILIFAGQYFKDISKMCCTTKQSLSHHLLLSPLFAYEVLCATSFIVLHFVRNTLYDVSLEIVKYGRGYYQNKLSSQRL